MYTINKILLWKKGNFSQTFKSMMTHCQRKFKCWISLNWISQQNVSRSIYNIHTFELYIWARIPSYMNRQASVQCPIRISTLVFFHSLRLLFVSLRFVHSHLLDQCVFQSISICAWYKCDFSEHFWLYMQGKPAILSLFSINMFETSQNHVLTCMDLFSCFVFWFCHALFWFKHATNTVYLSYTIRFYRQKQI